MKKRKLQLYGNLLTLDRDVKNLGVLQIKKTWVQKVNRDGET